MPRSSSTVAVGGPFAPEGEPDAAPAVRAIAIDSDDKSAGVASALRLSSTGARTTDESHLFRWLESSGAVTTGGSSDRYQDAALFLPSKDWLPPRAIGESHVTEGLVDTIEDELLDMLAAGMNRRKA